MDEDECMPLNTHKSFHTMGYNSDSALPVHRHNRRRNSTGSELANIEAAEGRSSDFSEMPVAFRNSRPFSSMYSANKKKGKEQNPSKHVVKRIRRREITKRMQTYEQSLKLRVSVYCTCDKLLIFQLLKWLQRADTRQLAGATTTSTGWKHKMYLGAAHSICSGSGEHEEPDLSQQKDVFYFATGCVVFWGLTPEEETDHLRAIEQFSESPVKQIEYEDMEFCYGHESTISNDEITLKTNDPSEKLALSFAIASSAKLDVYEQRVEETIGETKHIPEELATTGSIGYSKIEISKLIGRLFIVRADVNLNSDMLDAPDFFWEFDTWEPLYGRMMRYLDVNSRVEILNARLDVIRELLDVLNQELENQHAAHLEWIVIWLIVAEVAVQVVWNILIKDILGFFPNRDSD